VTAALVATLAPVPRAQQPSPAAPEPRFRGGTNLVRLDVYASVDGTAVTDLTADDFEVLEDNAPQQVTSFELVRPRAVVPDSARVEPNTVAESRARAAQPDSRLFVLFLDTRHVQVEGSYHAQNPVSALLDRVVGEDDLLGVMTAEMSARNITFSPRSSSVGRMLESSWAWGQRGRVTTAEPGEARLEMCYPDRDDTAGWAKALIERRRERATLDAIDDLIQHLEGTREERSFVFLLTEGWILPGRDESLARPRTLPGGQRVAPGGLDPLGTTPDGTLTLRSDPGEADLSACDRERALLALEDVAMEFRQLMQRANRANVSFYPIDPRGLVVFDESIGAGRRPTSVIVDAARLRARQAALRTLAAETDGTVVLNTNIERALPRLLTDIGAYYLLGYVSTNQKLDGRYRRLTVRVKRPGVEVRARPGYLAPTAPEFSAGQPPAAGAAPGPPSAVREALSRLPGGRTRPPMYLQTAGGSGYLQITVEIDRATMAAPQWGKGASVRVEVGPADSASAERQVEEIKLEAGKRVYALRHPARDQLAPGRYQVRAQITAEGVRLPLTLTTVATVPATDALLGSAAVASRRGPGTGRLFEPTADARFRRTERLVVETPLLAVDAALTARLLNRLGQPMAVPVTLSERLDESLQLRGALAELALAPLAPGEYVVEVTATKGTTTSTVTYGFRMIP
jgi:VWFA-related protein